MSSMIMSDQMPCGFIVSLLKWNGMYIVVNQTVQQVMQACDMSNYGWSLA